MNHIFDRLDVRLSKNAHFIGENPTWGDNSVQSGGNVRVLNRSPEGGHCSWTSPTSGSGLPSSQPAKTEEDIRKKQL